MSGHKNYITIEGCCDSSVDSGNLNQAQKSNFSDRKVMHRVREDFTDDCLRATDTGVSKQNIIIEDLSEKETTPRISNDSKIMRKKTSLVKMPILQLDKVHVNQSGENSQESKNSENTQHFKEVELGQLCERKFPSNPKLLTG